MSATATGWELEVQRGPGWLLVKARNCDQDAWAAPPLADQVWSLLERHFVYRLVLELDELKLLDSHLIWQLLLLHRRIRDHNGVMRLCGLSALNQRVLQVCGLIDRFPPYSNLEEAVMGSCRPKPR